MKCLALSTSILFSAPAFANGLQFQCGAMDGHSYYSDEGIYSQDPGWTENRIGSDTIISINFDDESIDYRINSLGTWVTPEMEGGGTNIISVDKDASLKFVAFWPNASTEVVVIAEIDSDAQTAIMLLAQGKNSSLGANASVFKGECTLASF